MNILFSLSNLIRKPFLFSTNRKQKPNPLPVKKLVPPESKLKISDIVECPVIYQLIMKILVEKEFCSGATHLWMDSKKGSKEMLIVLLKYLQVQGYCKEHHRLTCKEIIEISFNNFGVTMKIDHIDHTGINDSLIDFIPPARDLN